MDFISNYYGFDWLALLAGVIGIWQLGAKNRSGFLFYMIAGVFGLVFATLAHSVAYVVVNILILVLNIRGFILWGKDK